MDRCCHPSGRLVEASVAREMFRALGFEVCETCHRVTAIRWRQQRYAPSEARARDVRHRPRSLRRGW